MHTLSTNRISIKPFLSISKTYIPNVYVTQSPISVLTLMTFEKHFNTQTEILQAEQLCSLGFYSDAVNTEFLAGLSDWLPATYFLMSLISSWLTVCRAPFWTLSRRKDRGEEGGDVSHFMVVLSSRTSSLEAGDWWKRKEKTSEVMPKHEGNAILHKIVKGRILFQC